MAVEPWVTLQDLAKHLQVADDTIHRWISKKNMPATKAGRVWRFKISKVDAWLQAGGAIDGVVIKANAPKGKS